MKALGRHRRGAGRRAEPDDDRILRRYVNAIQATLRTNYFQRARTATAADAGLQA